MEIVYKSPDELILDDNNPRHNDEAAQKVAESIKEFGFINPISITPDNLIISGNTRLKAARLLGLEKVPCIIQNLDKEDVSLAGIIDNKSHEYSTWDVVKLRPELDRLSNFSPVFFSYTYRDLTTRITNLNMIFGNNKIPITESEYKSFKSVFDDYIENNNSYLGFISYILKGGAWTATS